MAMKETVGKKIVDTSVQEMNKRRLIPGIKSNDMDIASWMAAQRRDRENPRAGSEYRIKERRKSI